MSERERHALDDDRWDDWIAEVCTRLGVDRGLVDVPAIHDLTRQVAHRYERPMAPVSSYLVGIALGAATATGPGVDPAGVLADLIARVEATLPAGS